LELDPSEPKWIKTSSRSDSGLAFDTFSQDSIFANSAIESPDEEKSPPPRQVAFESSLTKEVEIENDANGWYDMLLLSLGLLINILETSPHCRELITSTGKCVEGMNVVYIPVVTKGCVG
jgi:hypothetical protein